MLKDLKIKIGIMKDKRFSRYLEKKRQGNTDTVKKEDIAENPDHKIDQDFPGYPHGQGDEKLITPTSTEDKKKAGMNHPANNERVSGNK